ncbi:MAG: efflux RND transporter periplasmic adaptor subunit, partial [Xanthobacteraceae bacterium]
MNTRLVGFACIAVLAAGAIYLGVRTIGDSPGASAQSATPRGIPVQVATAAKKKMPVRLDALGTVTPMASVAVKPRIDSEIVGIHFADGALVKQGDVLITLDKRSIEAMVQAAEGVVARDQAQLEGAERDMRRYTDLVSKSATPVTNLENATTQAAIYKAARIADEATLQNLKVQLSYATISAPITGRISAAALKVGNLVRSADLAPIATIIQTSPIYVSFSVPQSTLPDLRKALAAESATLEALVPGEKKTAAGTVTMIENTVDAGTGMVSVRATMQNSDEFLWPGTLVTARMTLREEDAVVVPSAAVQVSQAGSFVFVVKDGKAAVRPVKVARTFENEAVIESGVQAGEVVVTDGFLQLNDGAPVTVRQARA